jgi:hypothetical protein
MYKICTVELDHFSSQDFKEYLREYSGLVTHLNMAVGDDGGSGAAGGANALGKEGGGRDIRIHRRLGLLTFNRGLKTMVRRVQKNDSTSVEK